MHRFDFETKFVKINIELQEKYYLISGDSGRGKSLFISELINVINNDMEYLIKSTLPYQILDKKDDLKFIDFIIDRNGTTLFIVDEFLAHSTLKAIENKNAYCIAISRKPFGDINMSYKSLYQLIRGNSGLSYIIPEFKMTQVDNIESYDIVITEDKKAGYKYIKSLIRGKDKVKSAGGRDNVYKKMLECMDNSKLLIVVDGGGIACRIRDIAREIKIRNEQGKFTKLCLPECFEQILLCSGYIGWDKDIYNYFDIKENNTEHFCEVRIKELSKDKPYFYNHDVSRLTKCWTCECKDCENYATCEYRTNETKKEFVLKNGPAAMLLELDM